MGKGDHTKDRERDSRKLQIIRHHASSVSRAIWPANIRQSDAVGKFAQRKKSSPFIKTWKHLREYFAYLVFRLLLLFSRQSSVYFDRNLPGKRKDHARDIVMVEGKPPFRTRPESKHSTLLPETPMPSEPRIRFLETYDLSHSDIEHFLDTDKHRLVTSNTGRRAAVRHP